MKLADFERLAWQHWKRIPERYQAGVDGLVVERGALPHPTLPEVYTLGECLTESYPSDFGGPDTIRSAVVLYYGSFRALSRLDPEFDWSDELWETLTHELKHHLETLADEDALGRLDYAADENFKRVEGEPFAPLFYRSGDQVVKRVYRIETDFFIEQEYDAEPAPFVAFDWHGVRYQVARPPELGDVCFLTVVDGVEEWPPGELCLVLLRRRGLAAGLRALLRPEAPRVVQAEGVAEKTS